MHTRQSGKKQKSQGSGSTAHNNELLNPVDLLNKWKASVDPISIPLVQMTKRGV